MKNKKESGEIVIEATIVVTICILMIFLLISIGMYLYHAALVRVAANKTASDIALVYPYLDKEPAYGYTNYADYMNNHPYRNFSVLSDSFEEENRKKAEWYAYGLLETMSLRENEFRDAQVIIEIENHGTGGCTIKVFITDYYELPMGGSFLGMAGLPESIAVTASASADSFDILDQAGTYNFLWKTVDKMGESVAGKLLPAITKWLEFANRLINDQ